MSWGTPNATSRTVDEKILEFQYVRRMGGSDAGAPVQEFEEAASATFEAGQCVNIVNASGQIDECATGAASVLGVARKDATGTQGSLIPVELMLPDVVFLAKCDADPTQAQIGDLVDLVVTAGEHLVDVGASTDDLFEIVGLPTGFDDSTHEMYRHAYVIGHTVNTAQVYGAPV